VNSAQLENNFMKTRILVFGLCFALSTAAIAQVTLTNDSIEKMAHARLGDDVIVSLIKNQGGSYDVSPDTLRRPSPGQEPSVSVPKGEHRISFHARGDYILVPARVNGRRATLLLDTGAALSTFSIKILPSMDTDHRITMNMAKGSVSAFVVPAGFTLGDSEVKEQHCSFRRNIVVGDFKFGEADGVIGLDILSSFKTVTFDFKDSVLVLEDR
jgi:predicted aspartyl protease